MGPSIARGIRELITRGRLPMLDRLRGAADSVALLMTVPGIGPRLALRLHDLGIQTLEDLEAAAHDGRLEQVAGFGVTRLSGIRDSLAHRLARVRASPERAHNDVSIAELLDVDREYRHAAAAGTLRTIAPRRFTLPANRGFRFCIHAAARGVIQPSFRTPRAPIGLRRPETGWFCMSTDPGASASTRC